LHTHSHYSLLDGLAKIPDLVKKATQYQMPALAITDHGVMYGAVEFYQKALAAGIKPIIGVEAYVAPHGHTQKRPKVDERPYHLILLARNNEGYKNLLKLVSIAHLDGYYYKPRIDSQLLEQHCQGLIALTACLQGEIPRTLQAGRYQQAKDLAQKYQALFGPDHFYLELQDHPNLEQQPKVNQQLIELGRELSIPLVATNDIHYLEAADNLPHDILICLQTKRKMSDTSRMSYLNEDYSFRSPEKMKASFAHVPEAITNTLRIAEMCNVELDFKTTHLPFYELPTSITAEDYLKDLCLRGLEKKYGENITTEIQDRLDYELSIINKTGFASYFLIVQDFINWAKNNGVVVGPGRGSAAGSIVSYLTGITNLDPLKYNLLFERFLNPERISMPDIDTDFSDARRDDVIRYVANKYGHDHVAQIITFGTMAARVAIRDVGRVLGYSYGYCDRIAKLIPMFTDLETAITTIPELKEMYSHDPEAKKLIDLAKRMEGVSRHTSTHACGVLITKSTLSDYVPLQYASSSDQTIVSQYSLHPIEDLGLLKMDFLGLRNLTLIETTIEIIHKTIDVLLDIDQIPLTDKKTFRLFQKGETTGVFQFESAGMKRYLKQLKPTELEDIIAMVALYRPGPMELIPNYIDSKKGKHKPFYLHPKLEPILQKTHGIVIYQEQIMELARELAGFTYGEADVLRKAVGKKIKELLEKQERKMIDGMISNGINQSIAQKIWEFILPFARYGFNRSHAACYALIAYQTAYLKANYPAQFMAALLTSDLNNTDKIAMEIAECEKMGIRVLPPDINQSYRIFTVVKEQLDKNEPVIRFGLAAIKNVGHNIASAIISERRAKQEYSNLTDFLLRLQNKDLNKKSLESLIKAGAFDCFDDRDRLITNLDKLLAFNKKNVEKKNQNSLFADAPILAAPKLTLLDTTPTTRQQRLAWEKEFLGIYLSDHPLNDYKEYLDQEVMTIHDVLQLNNNKHTCCAGVITKINKIITTAGKPMLFALLEDPTSSVEVIVFTDQLAKSLGIWEEERIVWLKGRISTKDGVNKIICEEVELLQNRKNNNTVKSLTLKLPAQLKKESITQLKELLSSHPGTVPVLIQIADNAKANSSSYKIKIDQALLVLLEKIVGANNILLDK
ncbi:MAG: DNA polymerase III subunit alpha, partial [Candidatus Komeilibacteria bacterium CG_4_10_14_0_2_um_filter_37_10]